MFESLNLTKPSPGLLRLVRIRAHQHVHVLPGDGLSTRSDRPLALRRCDYRARVEGALA